MRLFAAVAMLVAALLATTDPCEAALAVRKTVAAKQVPAWAREAAARPAPATEAAAAVLHNEKIFEPRLDRGVRVTSRIVVKILKREALDEFGSHIAFYHKADQMISLRAWTFLPDGTIRIPDPILDVGQSPYVESGSVFEDTWLRTINAASGSTGATIVYESVVLEDLDLGANGLTFGHEDYPTTFARASLIVPPGWESTWAQTGDAGSTCARIDGGVACEARDLLPPIAEDRRPPLADVLPGCWLRWSSPDGQRGFRDWNAVGSWGEALTAPVLKELGDAARTAERLKPADPSDLLAAIGRAFEHAARDVRYVSIQLGIGGYRPHPPAVVAQRLFGDCKDKAFLLRAVLQEWGRPSYYLMVRTRGAGITHPEIPTPGQFDHVIAAVSLPAGVGSDLWSTIDVEGLGRLLLLDPTAREGQAWNLRDDDQGTLALLAHPGGGVLVRLPTQPPEAGQVARELRAAVDEQGGLLQATLGETWSGSRAAEIRRWYAASSDEERRRVVRAQIQKGFPGGELGAQAFQGLDRVDGDVRSDATIRGGWFGRRAAAMLIVQPGRFATSVVRASLPPPPRIHELVLDGPMIETIDSEIVVPAGWKPESLPAEFSLDTPELTARATWAIEDGKLRYRREARLRVASVPAERYAEFRTAVMRVGGADANGVVFVREP